MSVYGGQFWFGGFCVGGIILLWGLFYFYCTFSGIIGVQLYCVVMCGNGYVSGFLACFMQF